MKLSAAFKIFPTLLMNVSKILYQGLKSGWINGNKNLESEESCQKI